MTARAKLFMHGRSQAVRLPKEFRMPGTEVRVRKVGARLILEPVDDGGDPGPVFAEIDRILGDGGFLEDVEITDDPAVRDSRRLFDE